jgi:hypothetical protein
MATETITGAGVTTPFRYNGGTSTFAFTGDFASGSVSIEASFDGESGTFIPMKDASGNTVLIASNEFHNIFIGHCHMRFSATTAVNVNVAIH